MKPPRAWQRMLSGRRLDLLDPTPVDIEIEDIAHGLAFVARWNGQTEGDFAYSVAEHSLLVEVLFRRIAPKAPPKWQLAALLHDAPEYVIGDMISPVKAAVGPGYKDLDIRLTSAIHIRFGLPAAIPASAAVLGLRVATCRIDMSDLCLSLADPTRATCPTHGKSSQIRASKRTIRIILPGTAFAGRARARLTRRDTDTKAHALSALDGWCRGWWRRAQALRAGRKPRPLVALHRSRC